MENGSGKGSHAHVAVSMELNPVTSADSPENKREGKKDSVFRKISNLVKKPRSEFSSETEYRDNLREIESLLKNNSSEIFNGDEKGRNIFHVLASNVDKSAELLRIFLPYLNGSSLSQKNAEHLLYSQSQYGGRKFTPLHCAVENGYIEFLSEALDNLPSLLSAKDGEGNTPLHLAAGSSISDSLQCMTVMLDVVKKNDLEEEILLNTRNNDGQTCFHTICSKVPLNESCKVKEKFDLLLHFECSKNILKIVDKNGKNPLHLLCCKDNQIQADPDNNGNLQALLERLPVSKEDVNFPTQDDKERTALHLLSVAEWPQLIEIFLKKSKDINLRKMDKTGRMAIHYAAEKAVNTKSKAVAKILGSWSTFSQLGNLSKRPDSEAEKDAFKNYLLTETYEDDGLSQTALTSATNAPSPETVEFFLKEVYKVKDDASVWFAGKENLKEDFSFNLKQVYENTPAALEFLFDKAIEIDVKKSNEIKVEFTTDIGVLTALDRPIQEDKTFSETEYLGCAEDWPEDIQTKLLLHPMAQCALHAIWRKMIPYRILWTVINIVWLVSYFNLVPFHFSHEQNAYPTYQIIAAWILAVLTILGCLYYIYQATVMIKERKLLKLIKIRIFNWIQAILTAIVIYKVLQGNEPDNLEIYCAATGITLSFVLFWWNFGVISLRVGVEVQYQLQTLVKILRAILCVLPIVFGFLRSFQLLLPDYFSSNFGWGLSKMFVMMTGEQDFGDMYEKYKSENEDDKNATAQPNGENAGNKSHLIAFLPFLFFLFFLFLVSISFYNLVTAVAVDKIQSMRKKLEIHQIICQLRLINYVQRTIISVLDSLTICLNCSSLLFSPYVSYRSMGQEVILEQQLRWYIHKNIGGKTKNFQKNPPSNDALCGNALPKHVKEQIFKMYQKKID